MFRERLGNLGWDSVRASSRWKVDRRIDEQENGSRRIKVGISGVHKWCWWDLSFPCRAHHADTHDVGGSLLGTMYQFSQLNEEERNRVRESLEIKASYSVITFAVRMAIWAVRSNDADKLSNAALGIMMVPDTADSRDILRALAIMNDCSVRLGIPLAEIFAQSSTPEPAEGGSLSAKGFLLARLKWRRSIALDTPPRVLKQVWNIYGRDIDPATIS